MCTRVSYFIFNSFAVNRCLVKCTFSLKRRPLMFATWECVSKHYPLERYNIYVFAPQSILGSSLLRSFGVQIAAMRLFRLPGSAIVWIVLEMETGCTAVFKGEVWP